MPNPVITNKKAFMDGFGPNAISTFPSNGPIMYSMIMNICVPPYVDRALYDAFGQTIDDQTFWFCTVYADYNDYLTNGPRPDLGATGYGVISQSPTDMSYVQSHISYPSQSITNNPVTRTIGTAWQNTSGKTVNGSYSIDVRCQSLLLGTASQTVQLLIGPTSTPTFVEDTQGQTISGVVNVDNTNRVTLKGKIPIGYWAKIVALTPTGTASATYVSGAEQAEG